MTPNHHIAHALACWSHLDQGRLPELAQIALDRIDALGVTDRLRPREADILRPFEMLGPEAVNVVKLGQDPYPDLDHAMGLAFSTRAAKLPASLRNMYRELIDDLGVAAPTTGDLTPWAKQGILLANTSLTFSGKDAKTLKLHMQIWSAFTQAWIAALAAERPRVWVLWGKHAQGFRDLIKTHGAAHPHVLIESAHPSPFSAYKGFFGSKPYSKINAALRELQRPEIRWA